MKLYYAVRNALHTDGKDFSYHPVGINCDAPVSRFKKFIHDFVNDHLLDHDTWGNQSFVFMFYEVGVNGFNPIHALIGFTESGRPVYTFLD